MPEKVIRRGESWKQERERVRGTWPFKAARCESRFWTHGVELRCEHLVDHPEKAKHTAKHKGEYHEW